MVQRTKTINLALQGGGAHGALAWGIIDKLLEDGRVKIDSISASSAGAMNATILAYGLAKGGNDHARETLYNFWKMISKQGELYSPISPTPIEELFNVKIENTFSYLFFDMLTKVFSPYQLNPANFNPLRDILEKNVDFDMLRNCKELKLFLSATNVKTGKIKVFDNKELSVDAVMASACLPFLFQTVEVDNEYYWDGGYMGNPPIFPLIYNSDCRDILILHINPIFRDTVPKTAADILNRVNEVSFNSSLMREMRAINFVTRLIDDDLIKDKAKDQFKRIFIHAIRADHTMESYSVASKLNPQWKFLKHLYEIGRSQAEQWLKENFNKIGKKSSIDFSEYV